MRPTALMMPTLIDGGSLGLGSSVLPIAMAVWPILMSALGAATGTTSGLTGAVLNFKSVSMRVLSVAITSAM